MNSAGRGWGWRCSTDGEKMAERRRDVFPGRAGGANAPTSINAAFIIKPLAAVYNNRRLDLSLTFSSVRVALDPLAGAAVRPGRGGTRQRNVRATSASAPVDRK